MTSLQTAAATGPSVDPMAVPAPLPDIAVQDNPAPRQGHVLTIRFSGIPGTPEGLSASADFEVDNPECVAVDYARAVGGVRLPPRHSVALALAPQADGSYVATLYRDALLDQDYYGLGVCRWALRSATLRFHSATTRFIGGMKATDVVADGELTQQFLVRDFGHKPASMDVVYGESPGFYQASAGEQFTLALSARKEVP